jgi:hypothetical protein
VRQIAIWNNAVKAVALAVTIWVPFVVACLILKTLIHAPAIVHLLCGAVLVVIAGLVHVRSSALSASDREILASLLHGREARVLRWLGIQPNLKSNE